MDRRYYIIHYRTTLILFIHLSSLSIAKVIPDIIIFLKKNF